jgi:hypothetical protein
LFYVMPAPILPPLFNDSGKERRTGIMNGREKTEGAAMAAQLGRGTAGTISGAWRALAAFADWYSGHCRRIRAYQELTRLDAAALHAAFAEPDGRARLLAGEPPHRRR